MKKLLLLTQTCERFSYYKSFITQPNFVPCICFRIKSGQILRVTPTTGINTLCLVLVAKEKASDWDGWTLQKRKRADLDGEILWIPKLSLLLCTVWKLASKSAHIWIYYKQIKIRTTALWVISITNRNFPYFSPCEKGGRTAREIYIEIAHKAVFPISISL